MQTWVSQDEGPEVLLARCACRPNRRHFFAEVGGRGVASNKAAAARLAANVLPLILPMKADGKSLRQIAAALNERGIPTARGGKWAQTQVADILRRAAG